MCRCRWFWSWTQWWCKCLVSSASNRILQDTWNHIYCLVPRSLLSLVQSRTRSGLNWRPSIWTAPVSENFSRCLLGVVVWRLVRDSQCEMQEGFVFMLLCTRFDRVFSWLSVCLCAIMLWLHKYTSLDVSNCCAHNLMNSLYGSRKGEQWFLIVQNNHKELKTFRDFIQRMTILSLEIQRVSYVPRTDLFLFGPY